MKRLPRRPGIGERMQEALDPRLRGDDGRGDQLIPGPRGARGGWNRSFVATWFVLVLIASHAAPVRANGSQSGLALVGEWARTRDACKRPELVFDNTSARIDVDADGRPVSLKYSPVTYATDTGDEKVASVLLDKRHPYSKTPSPTELRFKILDTNHIGLMRKSGIQQFVRCTRKGIR
jgi:hypothetical protein